MKNAILLLLLPLLLISCSENSSDVPPPVQVDQAQTLVDGFDFDRADSVFASLEGQDIDPEWNAYGSALIIEQQGQLYLAMEKYMEIATRSPEFAPAYGGIARIYAALDLNLRSLDAAVKYADLSSAGGVPSFELARAYMRTHRFDEARGSLRDAVGDGFDPKVAATVEAQSYLMESDLESAGDVFGGAWSDNNASPEFYFEAARYFEIAGKIDSSVTLSRKALELSGGSPGAFVRHLKLCNRNSYLNEAKNTLDLLKEKDTEKILTHLMEMEYYWAQDDVIRAYGQFREYKMLVEEGVNTLFLEYLCAIKGSDYHTSKFALETTVKYLIEREPIAEYFAFVDHLLMFAFLDIEFQVEGVNRLRGLTGERAEGEKFHLDRAKLWSIIGEDVKYGESMRELRDMHGDEIDWLVRMADISRHKLAHNFEDAEKLYKLALSRESGFLPAFDGLITLLIRTDKIDEALEMYDEHPHFAENSPKWALVKAILQSRVGKTEDATELFLSHIPDVRADLGLYDGILQYLERKDAVAEMAKVIDAATELNGDNIQAIVRAAEWNSDIRRYDRAYDLAASAEGIDASYTSALVQKARAWYGMGKKKQAWGLFESLYKSDPNDSENNLYYSQALATEKRDFALASNLAKSAVTMGRNMLKAQYNLCYVYMQQEKYTSAVGKARQASQMFKTDPLAFYYLGTSCYYAGRPEAKEHLQTAVKLGIAGDKLAEVQSLLKKL